MSEKEIHWPSNMTFKSVFRNKADIMHELEFVLARYGLDGAISSKESSNGKFISYTITALFSSNEELEHVCCDIATIDGYMTMF